MPPRRRAADWQPRADEATLLRAFRWEVAQALKLAFTSVDEFNKQNKITFLRNYSEHVPLHKLWNAIVNEFAPPLQQKLALVPRVLGSRLPPELVDRVLRFLPGVSELGSLPDARRSCATHFFSQLEVKGGKLMVTLPKDNDWSSKKEDTRVSRLMAQPWVQRQAWWDQYAYKWCLERRSRLVGRSGPLPRLPYCLAARIVAIESEVTPVGVATTLGLPCPPADPVRERHSLELMIKLITRSDYRDSRSSRAIATMVVPDDASVAELDGWLSQLDESLESWCYLTIQDMDASFDEHELRRKRVSRQSRARQNRPDPEDEEKEAEHRPWLPPSKLCLRISRMQMGDYDGGYDSDMDIDSSAAAMGSPFRRVPVRGSRAALVAEFMAEYEAPRNFAEEGGWVFRHDSLSDPLADLANAEPRSTLLDITEHVAICDVLPMPEERAPLMSDFLAGDSRIFGFHVDMSWNHSGNEYELFALRRLPRLRDEDYPVVRRTNSTPRCPL